MKYLNKNLFTENCEKSPIRVGYGFGLLECGEDEKVVALSADLTESTKTDLFKKKYPNRFIQMGVSEQSMASVASGLAAMGKIPFFTSYSMFSPGRNWEQIRTTICYNNVNAKIVGSHAGISVGPDGGSHQAIEDVAITRVVPRMTVLAPCDEIEARKATIAAKNHIGPVYLRLQREATPIITTEDTPFEIGKAIELYKSDSPKITIFGYGAILYNALLVAKKLEKEGLGCIVVNIHTIKPLDKSILKYAELTKNIVVVEEHQRAGGLGGAIAELFSEEHPIKITRIGINDRFGQSGTEKELLEHYGLSVEKIIETIKKSI